MGMHATWMSFKAIGCQMGYHYTVVSRQVRKHTQQCERLAKIRQTTGNIWSWQHWLPNIRLSTWIVRNRLKSAGLKSRRVIKRPLLADRHRRSRLAWCLALRGWNLRTWRKIHWSDHSRFLLHVTDGRMRVWRHKHTRNTQPTVHYGGGAVMVCWSIFHDCKLDLVTMQGNLTGNKYIRDVCNQLLSPISTTIH